MNKIPVAILSCVLLFVFVVVGVLVAKWHGSSPELRDPTPSNADYRIKEVHLQEQDRGRASWQLDADSGEIFEGQGKTFMRKVIIRINEPGRAWTVSGDEGDLLRESKDVQLRGHVVVVSSDGLRVETSRLNWAAKEQRVWTDQPVTIWRPGVIVRGQGFESRVEQGATTIRGRVRATITGEQATNAEKRS